MNLGLGLYKGLLTPKNFQFAKQAGATHIVAQLVDYVKGDNPSLTKNYLNGWGETYNQNNLWTFDELNRLTREIESHGLKLEAIENFDPSIIGTKSKIGITASASSPEILVKKLLKKIEESFELNIIESKYEQEDTHFKIPQKLKEAV